MQLSKNFTLEEFTKGNSANDYQISLLRLLAENLQIVRDRLQPFAKKGKSVSITITSGLRTMDDYERLKKAGHNPSANSDHFCGFQPGGKPTLGAADIKVNNCTLSLKDVALLVAELTRKGTVHFGQVIYEFNPATGACWIHLGNDPQEVFKDRCTVTRSKYLQSLDNGKSYIALV